MPQIGQELRSLWQQITDDEDYHIYVGEIDGRFVSSVTITAEIKCGLKFDLTAPQ